MFTGPVDAAERLLVQEAHEPVVCGALSQDLHNHMIVIDGDIAVFVQRCDLKLAGSRFIVRGLHEDAHRPQFVVDVF